MTPEEFDAGIKNRLEELYHSEKNQKKRSKFLELEQITKEILEKQKEKESAIESEDYDRAVEIETELDALQKKSMILKGVTDKLRQTPDFEDKDLEAVCMEIIKFYRVSIAERLEQHLEQLKRMEQSMEEINNLTRSANSILNKVEQNLSTYHPLSHKFHFWNHYFRDTDDEFYNINYINSLWSSFKNEE